MKALNTFIILMIFISLLSCRKLISDEFSEPEKIPVVNSILKPGHPLQVQVSFPAGINSTIIETADNAEISLYLNDEYTETLSYEGDGMYQSTTRIEAGNSYRCEVVIPGCDVINCSDSVPEPPTVLEVIHINEAGRDEEGLSYPAIRLRFLNNPEARLYYMVNIRLSVYGEERNANLLNITDPLIINEGLPVALFSNQEISDTSYELVLNYFTGLTYSTGDHWYTNLFPLIVELRSVSYAYYEYAKSVYLYEQGRYPDGLSAQTTVFNTYSNIEDAYGIFSGYSAVLTDTIYPDKLQQ